MSLAKLLIAGVALAASTSALACDCSVGPRTGAGGGWSAQGGGYQSSGYQAQGYGDQGYQDRGYQDQAYQDQAYQGGGYQGGYQQQGYQQSGGYRSSSSSVDYGSSYERSGGYSEQTYDLSGAWARAHRGDAREDRGYGRSGYERSGYERSGYERSGYERSGGYEASGGDHYGYTGLREEGNARAYRSEHSYSETRGGGWSYSERSARFAPPPCRHLHDRALGGWRPLPMCPGEGEVAIDNGFFLGDGGGVGGFPDYDGGGGGGGYEMVGGSAGAGAHAFASASARASASVSIRFRGGFHGHGGYHGGGGHHGGGHKGGGCGCGK